MLRRLVPATILAAVAAGLVGVVPAQAATTTSTYTGVTSDGAMSVSNGTSTGSLPGGTAYAGSLTYDAAVVSSGPYAGGTHSTYRFSDLAMTVGGSTVHTGPGVVDVYDNLTTNASYPAGDSVYANFSGSVAPSGPLAGADFNWVGLAFLDGTGRAVSAGLLPADLSTPAWTSTFAEFNYGTRGTRWGAGNTSRTQPMTPSAGTAPAVPCTGTDAVVTASSPATSGLLVVNGGASLLDHLWTTDLTPAATTFLGGTTTVDQAGLVLGWQGEVAADGCHLSGLTVSPGVRFATTSLPDATVGAAYSAPVSAQWGVKPYVVSMAGLPSGLSFDGATLSGTPTTAGTFAVTGTVTDGVGATSTATWALTVSGATATTGPRLEGHGRITKIGDGFSSLRIGSTTVVWNDATVIKVETPAGPQTVVDAAVTLGMRAEWAGRRLAGSTVVLLTRLEIG